MKLLKLVGKFFSFVLVFVLFLVLNLYLMCLIFCYGPSKSARDIFVTTMLETGQMKFVVGLVMDQGSVKEIVDSNSMKSMKE